MWIRLSRSLSLTHLRTLFYNALSTETLGYANRTSLEFITHLLMYYTMIAPTELTQNYERLNTV
jgi:hypothetical protein